MIIKPHQSKTLFSKPDSYQTVLFYGPDGGLVRENGKKLTALLTKTPDDPFSVTQLDADKIKEEPSKLFEALSAMSLMGDNPIIVIRDAGDKLTSIIKEALLMPECQNQLVILAGELPKKSTLRSLIEKDKKSAALACYHDEGNSLAQIIRSRLDSENIKYQRETLQYLISSLGNDRGVTQSELDKLVLYMGDEKELTIEVVQVLTNENSETGIDDFCTAIVNGQVAVANQLGDKLLSEGNHPVMMIRAFSRYLQRLHMAHGYIAKGSSQDEAMKYLKPPVFFKQKDGFRRHLQKLNPDRIIILISQMNKVETEVKRTSNPQLPFMRAFTSVANHCKR